MGDLDKYGYQMMHVSFGPSQHFFKMSVIHHTLTESWQTLDVANRLDERISVYAGTAQLPRPVTTGADQLPRNLNELGAQRLHPIGLHSLRQAEAAKPIVEVVRQHGQLQFHDVGFKIGAAHLVASESVLGFLDEILHVAALKVEANDILR